jgi:hypothetical protein
LAALKTLVSWLALLFHFLFSLAMASLGGFGLASGGGHLRLTMLPWSGPTLGDILLFGGLFGLSTVALAAFGKLRFLFLIWSLAVAAVLTKALVLSGYRFPPGEWRRAANLVAGAWFAFGGALLQMFPSPARGPRTYRVK